MHADLMVESQIYVLMKSTRNAQFAVAAANVDPATGQPFATRCTTQQLIIMTLLRNWANSRYPFVNMPSEGGGGGRVQLVKIKTATGIRKKAQIK